MTEPHVFISYDRTDQGAAEQVRARLLASQVKTWMDRYDIPAGAYWPDEIDVGLRQATLILGLLSPDAVTSRNVKNEWDWAIHNAKPLILLKIRPSETPHRYVSINYIDATKHGLDTALDQLMRIPDLQSAPGSCRCGVSTWSCRCGVSAQACRCGATDRVRGARRPHHRLPRLWRRRRRPRLRAGFRLARRAVVEASRDGRVPAGIGVIFAGHARRRAWHGHVRTTCPYRLARRTHGRSMRGHGRLPEQTSGRVRRLWWRSPRHPLRGDLPAANARPRPLWRPRLQRSADRLPLGQAAREPTTSHRGRQRDHRYDVGNEASGPRGGTEHGAFGARR